MTSGTTILLARPRGGGVGPLLIRKGTGGRGGTPPLHQLRKKKTRAGEVSSVCDAVGFGQSEPDEKGGKAFVVGASAEEEKGGEGGERIATRSQRKPMMVKGGRAAREIHLFFKTVGKKGRACCEFYSPCSCLKGKREK